MERSRVHPRFRGTSQFRREFVCLANQHRENKIYLEEELPYTIHQKFE
jgi:hypothetical protein